jgi:hypothetical protein
MGDLDDPMALQPIDFSTCNFLSPTYEPELFINLKNRPEKAMLWSE